MPGLYNAIINGKWVGAASGMTTAIVNPANGKVVAEVTQCGIEELESAVSAAHAAGPGWANTPVAERAKVLLRASRLIMQHQRELAELETLEHGSPIRKTMNFDVPLCAEQFEYFAGAARAMTGSKIVLEEYTLTKHIYMDITGNVDKPWYAILK